MHIHILKALHSKSSTDNLDGTYSVVLSTTTLGTYNLLLRFGQCYRVTQENAHLVLLEVSFVVSDELICECRQLYTGGTRGCVGCVFAT
jgi:hypothetical protein